MEFVLVVMIAVGGGLGAATRFVLDGVVRVRWNHVFPLATVVINVAGSLLIGIVNGGMVYLGWEPTWLAVATTGFCGGLTTFSTAMVETVRLMQAEQWRWAVVNVLGTLVVCVGAAAAGTALMWAIGG